MTTQFIIGIDGGGTKTYGRIENLTTGERYEAKQGPSSLTNDFNSAVTTITDLLRQLMEKVACTPEQTSVVIGVAGGGVESQADKLTQILTQDFAALLVCNDAKTSLYGANNGQPVAVVALGTGSVGARLDADGREYYFGGWGFPIGDEGGGAKLGFHAIQAMLQEIDEYDRPSSLLSKQLFARLGSTRLNVENWLRNATPTEYGELCPNVFSVLDSCPLAQKLVAQHAQQCEELIRATRRDTSSPIILLGGLAKATMPHIKEHCELAKGTALDGACLLAKQQISAQSLADNSQNTSQNKTSDDVESDFALLQQLNHMVSEGRNPDTMQIDLMDSKQILTRINAEDKKVPLAVEQCIEPMSKAVDAIVNAFKVGGRLIYIGAGTSGRLGILDAVECPPTFSVSHEQVIGIIAGGNQAIHKSVEGAEDDVTLGETDLKNIKFSDKDILVGIAASGRTPYVIGALDYANSLGSTTVSVTCNPDSEMSSHADISICPVVGPEVLSGSTRMKSGTSQKLVLNMLTTAAMIRSGKTYENLMVDVSASNKKLYMRAIRIVMQATQCDSHTAEQALNKTNFVVKTAILHILTGVEPNKAEQVLEQNDGFLRRSVASLTA